MTTVILVHGRNAGPENIRDLIPRIDRPSITYLAPAAANRTWYPYSFLTETAKNEPALSNGLDTLHALVEDVIAKGTRKDHIILLGFSQGACLAAEYAARHADRYGGIIVYSGGLIGPPGTSWNYGGSFAATPIFLGCSDVDAHIPKERVDESADVFTRMGALVTKRFYAGMGHLVNDHEIAYTQTIIDEIGVRPRSDPI